MYYTTNTSSNPFSLLLQWASLNVKIFFFVWKKSNKKEPFSLNKFPMKYFLSRLKIFDIVWIGLSFVSFYLQVSLKKCNWLYFFFSILVAYCDCIPCVIDICKYVAYFFPCSTYFFGTVLRWDMASSTHKFIRKVVEKKYTMYSKYL